MNHRSIDICAGLLLAWVLWWHTIDVQKGLDSWMIAEAFESKTTCEESLSSFTRYLQSRGYAGANLRKDGAVNMLLCLPESVDPRR